MSSYGARHDRVRKARGKAATHVCSCGKPAQEWAQTHGTDGESPDDYTAMCCSCHQKYDNHWNDETRAKVRAAHQRINAETPEVMANSRLTGYGNKGRARPDMIGNRYAADAIARKKAAG